MKYLFFTKKSKTEDGKFKEVLYFDTFNEARSWATKNNLTFFAATAAEIHWLKNDEKANKNGKSSLPKDFKI